MHGIIDDCELKLTAITLPSLVRSELTSASCVVSFSRKKVIYVYI